MIVLVADDDVTSLRLLEKATRDLGYEVITAADGLAAWSAIRRQDVRMVVADWEMPGMSGLSLCRRVRAGVLGRYVYMVLLTSKTDKSEIIEGMEAGADDYLTKPFNRAELSARLRVGSRIVDLELDLSAKTMMLEDLNTRLERTALTDPLLGIGNRRGLYEVLEKLKTTHAACESGFALIMCDVDNFKSYNDAYGHIAGDKTLIEICAAMKGRMRDQNGLYRYGGEEIVAFLPAAAPEEAVRVAERCCRAVEALAIPHRASPSGTVTISCGVSACLGKCKGCRGWEAIISEADEALYRAKAAGKNRVEAALETEGVAGA